MVMDLKASIVVLKWYFSLIIHGDGCIWRFGFFPSMKVLQGISSITFFVGMLSILLYVELVIYSFLQVSLQVVLELGFFIVTLD